MVVNALRLRPLFYFKGRSPLPLFEFAGSLARDFERPPRTLRWGDFLYAQKVTKEAHRGLSPVYPLMGSGITLFLPCRGSIADSFGKTLYFSFRCRCSGADLWEMRSIALPQPQANSQRRRPPMARQILKTTSGAAAIISGFVCRHTPRRSVERCTT